MVIASHSVACLEAGAAVFPPRFDELKAAAFYSGIRNLKHFIIFSSALWELTLQLPPHTPSSKGRYF